MDQFRDECKSGRGSLGHGISFVEEKAIDLKGN